MARVYEKKDSIAPDTKGVFWKWLPTRLLGPAIHLYLRAEKLWSDWIQVGLRQDVRRKSRVIARLMRSLILGLFSFEFNQIPVRSAALTYTTILGIVPFVVILSAVAGRFGYLDLLQRFLPFVFESLNLDFPLDPILGLLEKAEGMNFKALGMVGSVGLLASFFLAMNNIELAIDHIWNLRKPRNVWGTVKIYTPFLFMLIALVGVLGNAVVRFGNLVNRVDFQNVMPALRHGAVAVVATVVLTAFIWLVLSTLLMVVPNTKVKLVAAMVGASVTTALLFGLTRLFFFFPHLLYSQNNVVLGSLAFLPAMLVFIYVVWMLILYGAAVAFIYQKLFRESLPMSESSEPSRDNIASDDRENLFTDVDDDEDETEFTQMERRVLSVLAAMQTMAGEIEIQLPPLTPDNEPRIFKEANAVRAQDLANHLKESLENVDRAALPLHELGWIRRRGRGPELIYVLKAESRAMDLLALHSLLVRINPKGTALLRNLNMLEEIKHTLSLLYSKSKDHPPLSLQTARGIPPA